MTFSTRLKELRKERGYNQEQLAEKLNKSKSSISSYESGRRTPDIESFREMAEFFNVSIDYLTGNSKLKNDPNSRIKEALESDPELLSFWEDIEGRSSLKLLFKQTRDLPDEAIQDIVNMIKRIEGR